MSTLLGFILGMMVLCDEGVCSDRQVFVEARLTQLSVCALWSGVVWVGVVSILEMNICML